MPNEYQVTLYFDENKDHEVFNLEAPSLEKTIFDVSKMIEDKKVVVDQDKNRAYGYNMGYVKTFHVAAK
ncbi:hypothetical protein [Lysinibacillus fusiformis]|uniref:hypothetical protein n=1 Tax=Lysinibacillus fusiformis TaxID=28031 RepID=UPI002E1A2ED9|nr:hypothetical protein [Lysinibacillus fusiformis]